jgi:sigma-B regulation protein RsbU (phosphoserine phosphatase)
MTTNDNASGFKSLDAGIFRSIFSGQSGSEESRAIHELVDNWCGGMDGCSAALYSPSKGLRLAVIGDIEFPDRAEDSVNEQGFLKLELPGGGLLLHNSERPIEEASLTETALLGAAAAVIGMKRKLREQNLRAMAQGVELVALYEVGLAIASILDIEELAEEVLSRALMLTECSLGALYTLGNEKYRLACAKGEAKNGIAKSELDLAALKKSGGKPDLAILQGAETVLAVSVEAEGQPRGLLAVGRPAGEGGELTAKDRSTLSLFANQAAIALEQARLHQTEIEKQRLESEMEVAAEIQREILPDTMPSIPGFDVAGWNRPARHVGGDYFGFKKLQDERWALVLGDVSGKGAGAALLVSTLDSALRVLLAQMAVGVELAERLNAHVWESSAANKFITLVASALDPVDGTLDYVNAGHNEGLLVRSSGEVEHLEAAGSPIGMLPQSAYRLQRVNLFPGDLVCFYSDGITECEAPNEEEYEIERLTEVLQSNRHRPLDEIMAAIESAVTDYRAGLPQGDDQTVILLRRERSREG